MKPRQPALSLAGTGCGETKSLTMRGDQREANDIPRIVLASTRECQVDYYGGRVHLVRFVFRALAYDRRKDWDGVEPVQPDGVSRGQKHITSVSSPLLQLLPQE